MLYEYVIGTLFSHDIAPNAQFLFVCRPVWETSDRALLRVPKWQPNCCIKINLSCLRSELEQHLVRSLPEFEIAKHQELKDYWDEHRLQYNPRVADSDEKKAAKKDFKNRYERLHDAPGNKIVKVYPIHNPAFFHNVVHSGLMLLQLCGDVVKHYKLDTHDLWFNFHAKLAAYSKITEGGAICVCGQLLIDLFDNAKQKIRSILAAHPETKRYENVALMFELLRRYQNRAVVKDVSHRVLGLFYGYGLWIQYIMMFEFVEDASISGESGAPMNDFFVSINVFMLKYGLGGKLLSELNFEGSPYFQNLLTIKRNKKKQTPLEDSFRQLMYDAIKKNLIKALQKKPNTIIPHKPSALRGIDIDISLFTNEYRAIVGIFEIINVLHAYFDWRDDKNDWTIDDFVQFWSNGSLSIGGHDETEHENFLLSWDGRTFTKTKKCQYKRWKKTLSEILKKIRKEDGKELLQETELLDWREARIDDSV